MKTTDYSLNENFEQLLEQLQSQSPKAWKWLIAAFRKRLMPWLMSKTTTYSPQNMTNRTQFVEEVFEESLFKFYELFKTGDFSNYGDLEATIVTVAKYKLKEGFARLKKERRWYTMESEKMNIIAQKNAIATYQISQQEQTQIHLIRQNMSKLKPTEKVILNRFFAGEELQDIAEDLNISAASCRKRKQRIVEKLKNFVLKSMHLFF